MPNHVHGLIEIRAAENSTEEKKPLWFIGNCGWFQGQGCPVDQPGARYNWRSALAAFIF